VATESRTIVTYYVNIVEQLTLNSLEHENITLLQLRLVLGGSLALSQLL